MKYDIYSCSFTIVDSNDENDDDDCDYDDDDDDDDDKPFFHFI